MSIRLVAISDTHRMHNKLSIPECDILVHCGDFCGNRDSRSQYGHFLKWMRRQPARHKIFIAGNHDLFFESDQQFKKDLLKQFSDIHYLENSGVEVEGLYFWGSPCTPEYYNWAFMYKRRSPVCHQIWEMIPKHTDILLCHGPASGICDRSNIVDPQYPQNTGCEILREKLEKMRCQIKYFLHGHCHEARGMDYRTLAPLTVINVSTCNFKHKPLNPPVVLDIDRKTTQE